MRAPLLKLLICFGMVVLVASCKQNAEPKATGKADQHKIDSLITLGKKLQNQHIDSLKLVAKQLNDIADSTGDKRAFVYSELVTAQYYWLSSQHQKSMEVAVKCLGDAEKNNITRAYPIIYALMGNLHKENSNYKMAFDAEEQGLKWAIANKDTNNIIALLGLKAMFMHSYHLFLHNNSFNDTSINLQFEALKVAESSPKYEKMRIRFYDNIAQYYLDNKKFDEAISYANKGVALALKYNQQRSLTYSYCWLGQAHYFKGDKVKGLDYLNRTLAISKGLKEPFRVMEIYGHMYDCYYSSGDYKQATDVLHQSSRMHDSLQIANNEKQISELQLKYESVKKDKEIVLMGRQEKVKNRMIVAALAGIMLFIAFSFILFLQYRVISRNNKVISMSNDQKGKALESIAHIQAHELRKPLASIMGLINVIKTMDYEFDKECILKLEESGKELDAKIHAVLAKIDKEAQ